MVFYQIPSSDLRICSTCSATIHNLNVIICPARPTVCCRSVLAVIWVWFIYLNIYLVDLIWYILIYFDSNLLRLSHSLLLECPRLLILTIGCWSPAAYRVCESCLCCPRCARRWRGLWGKSSGWYWQGWPFLETEWCNRMILLGGEGAFGENQVDDTENWQGTWLGTLLMPNTPWNN